QRVEVRKALKTDRVLKFGRDTIRIHSVIVDQSKPLRELAKGQGVGRTTYNVDALKNNHGLLSIVGLRHAIDFMYGQPLDVNLNELYDLFAAAHALNLTDLLDAMRAELIKMSRDPALALFALEHAYNHLSPPAEETARNASLHLVEVSKQEWCRQLTTVAFEALIKEASYLCPIALDVDVYACTVLDWLSANPKEITLARKLLTHIDLRDASPSQNVRIRDRLFALRLLEPIGACFSYALSHLSGGDGQISSREDQRSSVSFLDSLDSALLSERTAITPRAEHSWRSTADETSIRMTRTTPKTAKSGHEVSEERVLCYDFGEIPLPPRDDDGTLRVVTVSMDLDNDENVWENLRSLRLNFDFDTRPTL
ncbi:hypothetical protein PFISCL1PPCAC_21509, partial [Pristionchus fissidentatus]